MITDFFSIDEIVCQEVYHKYGIFALNFFDMRLLVTMEAIRMRLNKPIHVNDYSVHGKFTQRGFRCVQCQLQKDVFQKGDLFSDHHAD